MYDVLRADRCISGNSLEGRVPFGDLDFVRYVMSIDPEMKMNKYGKGKYLLRKAFEGDYLPDEILRRLYIPMRNLKQAAENTIMRFRSPRSRCFTAIYSRNTIRVRLR